MLQDRLAKLTYETKVRGKRHRGRPMKTWKIRIKEAFEEDWTAREEIN
ncbi:unnamed protein product [Nezara viridula]|uniref:Uncharacterized protein n=1 Tax=Nezara viridula TaxID=85310 RepID=A0A9P0MV64_NEZVI|nr:unnamed protein product [Nezara viridula]